MNVREWILVLGLYLFLLSFLSIPMQCISLVIIGFYHHKRFMKGTFIFLCISILFIIRIHIPKDTMPKSHIYELVEVKSNYAIAAQEHNKIIVYGLENACIGDIYELNGYLQEIDTVSNFDCFSFEDWCHRKGIYYSLNVNEAKLLAHGKKFSHHLYHDVHNLKKPYRSFVLMMLYGIHQEDVNSFMISIGMHLSLICGWLRKRFKKKQQAEFICICLLGFIVYSTQASASLWRMMIFSMTRLLFYKENRMNKLGISMVITLFLLPYMYCEMSFIIPVAFSFVSIFCVEKYPNWFKTALVMIPIQFIYYHQVSILQMLCFRYLRIIYAILYVYAWVLLLVPLYSLFPIVTTIIEILNSLSFQSLSIYGSVPILFLFLYIEALIKLFQKKSMSNYLIYSLCLGCMIFQSKLCPFTRILTLDVGQGDCSVMIEPFARRVTMIDVMGSLNKNIPKDIIVDRLNALGIRRINDVIITHNDYDHSGGLNELKELIKVDHVIANKEDAKDYHHDHLKLLLLDYQGIDENDNSIVSFYEEGDTSILLMGDLGITGEQVLLNQYPLLKSDIIKVGLHGSNTSSSKTFIHQLQPQLALISAGRRNRYNHPHPDVIELLKKEEVYLHTTSIQGEGDLYITPIGTIFINTNYEILLIK